jgi:hypothetical protein
MNIPKDVLDLHKLFKKNKRELFVVGGAVRDALLGQKPKDFDLATDAKPEEVIAILKSGGVPTIGEVGQQFGVVIAKTPSFAEGMEIATFREDIGKGRRPDAVKFSTIDQDVLRRDLTIYDSFFDLNDSLKTILHPSLSDTVATLTFISLDKITSDFDQFLGWTPENIYMDMSMVANPDLAEGDTLLFIFPPDTLPDREFNAGAQIFTNMSLELPMSINLDDLAVPVDLDSITVDVDVATLDSLQLRVVTYNMLPFGALLNLQFLDASGVVLYSLEEGFQVLANPPLNSINFNVKEPEININQVWLTGEGIDALNDTQTIKIIMTLNTTDGAPTIYTPLLEDYTLEVKISGKVRLSYEL